MRISVPAINKNNKVAVFDIQTLLFTAGTGECRVTGQVDISIEEMVQTALSHLRYNSAQYGLSPGIFRKHDLHVHFTEGSYRKEGSSAGLGAAVVIMCEILKFKSKKVSILASGEIDLYGGLLEIGGMREKLRYFTASRQFDYFIAPAANLRRSSGRIIGFENLFQVHDWLRAL